MKARELGLLACCCVLQAYGAEMEVPPFGRVRVLDAVDCRQKDHRFREYPEGASRVDQVLGKGARVMPMQGEESSYMVYRLGEGKGLKANGSYVVVMEFPDDVARNYTIFNRSTDSKRSFCTGEALGDAWAPKYVDNFCESLALPQSGGYQVWTAYGSLMDRTRDAEETTVVRKDAQGNVVRNKKGEEVRDPVFLSPADGFDFVIAQYGRDHDPVSHGIAVRRIWLCEIPDEKPLWVKLELPPEPLPKRHIFWREEMSDGGPLQGDMPQCANREDWFDHKARQMKMLGINTYMKDLMEFGHVQHWNPDVIRPNWAWKDAQTDYLWEKAIERMARDGFSIFPYYEWCGNRGADFEGRPSHGNQKRAETLGGKDSYTHIGWTEGANLDITDPEALEETKRLLEGTIVRFKDRAEFVGALFRTRPSQWPVSFSDATRARFSAEMLGGRAVSRADLKRDAALYERYLEWWHGKRAAFLAALQAYLEARGVRGASVVLSSESSEPGSGIVGGGFVVDDKAGWSARFASLGWKEPQLRTTAEVVAEHAYLAERRKAKGTWGEWEWNHACPGDDPERYNTLHPKVWLAMPFNRLFSVADPAAFAAYRNASGTETIVRHYTLNENMLYRKPKGGAESRLCGYAISDVEHAGRACMMNEVYAMAHGDPVNLGYFMGSTFSRGFPIPVREFNANFLALPAMPSRIVSGACDHPNVVLREIDCTAQGLGRYYALVHTGATAASKVTVRFPQAVRGRELTAIVAGRNVAVDASGAVTFERLAPWQLLALRSR